MSVRLATFPSLVLATLQLHADQCGDPESLFLANSGTDYLLFFWQAQGAEGWALVVGG